MTFNIPWKLIFFETPEYFAKILSFFNITKYF